MKPKLWKEISVRQYEEGPPHFIVLQHGFLGCSYDMQQLKNCLMAELPAHTYVLTAKANDENNQDTIGEMADRLAAEIVLFCSSTIPELLDPTKRGGRVSFIGHSLGGLVVRKVLEDPRLKVLLPKLHLYISLASPHVGTLYAESQLVSTGSWVLFQIKRCTVLKELSLEDSLFGNYRSGTLYKLSNNGTLGYFQKVGGWVCYLVLLFLTCVRACLV